mmetsp:Transcript_4086/g.7324  ORF Transcript_4086/g.7324 Transcript_4086/m.7324 type:complete len:263 (+) Transcript_4086:1739-2527(+)
MQILLHGEVAVHDVILRHETYEPGNVGDATLPAVDSDDACNVSIACPATQCIHESRFAAAAWAHQCHKRASWELSCHIVQYALAIFFQMHRQAFEFYGDIARIFFNLEVRAQILLVTFLRDASNSGDLPLRPQGVYVDCQGGADEHEDNPDHAYEEAPTCFLVFTTFRTGNGDAAINWLHKSRTAPFALRAWMFLQVARAIETSGAQHNFALVAIEARATGLNTTFAAPTHIRNGLVPLVATASSLISILKEFHGIYRASQV